MSAPLPQPRRPMSPIECRQAADLVNAYIANGVPDDAELRLLSSHELDALPGWPELEPGQRVFGLWTPPGPGVPYAMEIVLVAVDKPESDCIAAPRGQLLASVVRIERHWLTVDDAASDLETLPPMTRRDRLEASKDLSGAVAGGNADCDVIRAIAAAPANWPPIGPDAYLEGACFIYPLRDGVAA